MKASRNKKEKKKTQESLLWLEWTWLRSQMKPEHSAVFCVTVPSCTRGSGSSYALFPGMQHRAERHSNRARGGREGGVQSEASCSLEWADAIFNTALKRMLGGADGQ